MGRPPMPSALTAPSYSHLLFNLLQSAVLDVIREGKYRTGDLGGKSTTSDFTKAIIGKL